MYGFRPNDEQLLTLYLAQKTLDNSFSVPSIPQVDLTQLEPCDLRGKAKTGDNELYFFHRRGQRYVKGPRVKRSTKGGFWKQSGYDKEIYDSQTRVLLGRKKKLVFYIGRHPQSEKTSWIMDEYTLGAQFLENLLHQDKKDEWVLCKVFERNENPNKSKTCRKRKAASIDHPEVSPLPSLSNATNSSSESSIIITSTTEEKTNICSNCDNPDVFRAMPNAKVMIPYANCPNSLSNLENDQNMPVLPLQGSSLMPLPTINLGGFEVAGLQASFESTQSFSNGNQEQHNNFSESSLVEPYFNYSSLLLMPSPISTDFGLPEKEWNDISCLDNNHGNFQGVNNCYNHQEQEEINGETWDAFVQRFLGTSNIEQVDDAQTLSTHIGQNLIGGIYLTLPKRNDN